MYFPKFRKEKSENFTLILVDFEDVVRGELRHRRCRPWPRAPCEAGMQLYFTLPVANKEGECSFSILKWIKNRLQSNISQDKASDLSALSIESSITRNLNCDQIIKSFARDKA
jgi:hypothetical protein